MVKMTLLSDLLNTGLFKYTSTVHFCDSPFCPGDIWREQGCCLSASEIGAAMDLTMSMAGVQVPSLALLDAILALSLYLLNEIEGWHGTHSKHPLPYLCGIVHHIRHNQR